jgi:uncharacterized protein YegP (UPF0339 family)
MSTPLPTEGETTTDRIASDPIGPIFQVWKDEREEWRWRLRAANHEIIAQGESYKRLRDCIKAIQLIKACAIADVVLPGNSLSSEEGGIL